MNSGVTQLRRSLRLILVIVGCLPFLVAMKGGYAPYRSIYTAHGTVTSSSGKAVAGTPVVLQLGFLDSFGGFVKRDISHTVRMPSAGSVEIIDTLADVGYTFYTAVRLAAVVGTDTIPGPIMLSDSAAMTQTLVSTSGCRHYSNEYSTRSYVFAPSTVIVP